MVGKPSSLIGIMMQSDCRYSVVVPGRSTITLRACIFCWVCQCVSFDSVKDYEHEHTRICSFTDSIIFTQFSFGGKALNCAVVLRFRASHSLFALFIKSESDHASIWGQLTLPTFCMLHFENILCVHAPRYFHLSQTLSFP